MTASMPSLLFGAIADDLTGGTELASMLVASGIPTGCTVGLDAPIPSGNLAHVILLKTRVIAAGDAVRQVLEAADRLVEAGARQIFFKYCATFDSTPAGNIGPCAEALLERLGGGVTLFTPALCETGRTVYQGHMFGGAQLLARIAQAVRSADADDRFQPGARAAGAEQGQGRTGALCSPSMPAPRRSATPCASRARAARRCLSPTRSASVTWRRSRKRRSTCR